MDEYENFFNRDMGKEAADDSEFSAKRTSACYQHQSPSQKLNGRESNLTKGDKNRSTCTEALVHE